MDLKMLLVGFIFGCLLRESTAVCAVDMCTLGVDMCPGRTCTMTEECTVQCICDENSTAVECSSTTSLPNSSTSSTELNDVSVSLECLCVHGNCTGDHYENCDCEEGWSGDMCDLECNLDCDPGYVCTVIQGPWQITLCSPIIKTTTLSPPTQTSELQPSPRVYNVCSEAYTMRPPQERICPGGLPCRYGVCRSNGSQNRCECDPGATGQLCQDECCKQCVYGDCFYNIVDKEEMCNCYVNYSGPFCDIWDPPRTLSSVQPKDPTWHYWVVGSCVFVLLLLICLIIVVPYYLWKHRVILVMKVVHYFQEYEDDDDREWDVFISYKSAEKDESFVVETLFPKLEKEMGFKTNVHFRDFIAGETISNNIIAAVQGSRRTIMVISPSYVTSEFTKFEYQVAQQEMLKRKHRIIPILLDDISECKETMDPMLKVILGSVTYIEWPKSENEKKLEKFWKRIELSMPKKKNRSTESQSAPSVNSGLHPSTKPPLKSSDIDIDMSDKTKPINGMNGHTDGNIYTVIDESKLNNEEIYDTLNESEMLTQVIKRKNEANERKQKQDELLNVLKVDL